MPQDIRCFKPVLDRIEFQALTPPLCFQRNPLTKGICLSADVLTGKGSQEKIVIGVQLHRRGLAWNPETRVAHLTILLLRERFTRKWVAFWKAWKAWKRSMSRWEWHLRRVEDTRARIQACVLEFRDTKKKIRDPRRIHKTKCENSKSQAVWDTTWGGKKGCSQ